MFVLFLTSKFQILPILNDVKVSPYLYASPVITRDRVYDGSEDSVLLLLLFTFAMAYKL